MHEHLNILFRTIIAFGMLLVIARVLGKPILSNMTFFDFVTGISLGAIAANLAFNLKVEFWHTFNSLLVFAATAYIISVISIRSRKARKWFTGSPTILIEGGKILEKNMKHVKYSLDSLMQSLREKDIFDLEEVEYVSLENNGKISVMKKAPYRNVTRKDMKMKQSSEENFPIELILNFESTTL